MDAEVHLVDIEPSDDEEVRQVHLVDIEPADDEDSDAEVRHVNLLDIEPADDEDSDAEDSDASPILPWTLDRLGQWASLSHRLLVRQGIRNRHCCAKAALEHAHCPARIWHTLRHNADCPDPRWSAHYMLKTWGRLLQTFRQRTDLLSQRAHLSYIDGTGFVHAEMSTQIPCASLCLFHLATPGELDLCPLHARGERPVWAASQEQALSHWSAAS